MKKLVQYDISRRTPNLQLYLSTEELGWDDISSKTSFDRCLLKEIWLKMISHSKDISRELALEDVISHDTKSIRAPKDESFLPASHQKTRPSTHPSVRPSPQYELSIHFH